MFKVNDKNTRTIFQKYPEVKDTLFNTYDQFYKNTRLDFSEHSKTSKEQASFFR